MTDRELMQQALDALEYAADEIGCPNDDDSIGIARKALRARLAQPEPYAAQAAMVAQQTQGRMYVDPVTGDVGIGTVKWDASAPLVVTPHPAFKKPWVGLTDEECLQNPYCAGENDAEVIQLARAIEAKLKEKNA